MALQVFLAATLRKYLPGYDAGTGHSMEVPQGATVLDVASRLGIPPEEVKIVMVNGVGARLATPLEGDERVALFPPVGGG
ncbi:MAG: MoaD/ThiS family protein [Syntrophobacteraceae bacterium]|jgi:sulfur carrier protein ThiS|nr:MoaD/ThiS family protein [Syntrophobacteraceae bacterium]